MDRAVQQQYVFGAILLLANKLQVWGDDLLDNLTVKQWFLLMFISQMNTTEPTVHQIAEYTGTSRQNTKKMLEHLHEQGFVAINPSSADGRALSVKLTLKTGAYFRQNAGIALTAVSELFTGLPDADLRGAANTADHLLAVLGNPPLNLSSLESSQGG